MGKLDALQPLGIDGQVLTDIKQRPEDYPAQPAWLWYENDRFTSSTGRWGKGEQVAYIRGDIIAHTLTAQTQAEGGDELVSTMHRLFPSYAPAPDIAALASPPHTAEKLAEVEREPTAIAKLVAELRAEVRSDGDVIAGPTDMDRRAADALEAAEARIASLDAAMKEKDAENAWLKATLEEMTDCVESLHLEYDTNPLDVGREPPSYLEQLKSGEFQPGDGAQLLGRIEAVVRAARADTGGQ